MDVTIRKFLPSDIDGFYEAVIESIDHVSPWLPWCTPEYSRQHAESWVMSAEEAWSSGEDYRFIIECKQSKKILGSVGFNHINTMHRIANLGYWVRRSALGQGVTLKAAQRAIQFAFSEMNIHRIEVIVLPNNIASLAIAHKLGGKHEGTLRNKLHLHGQSYDAECFSIIPSDYTQNP